MSSDRDYKLSAAIIGDLGVALARFKLGKLGFIFREKPTLDYGIDGEIELVEDGRATGRLIAAQIKCGDSYFGETTDSHIVYRFTDDHFQYWLDHSLPVVVILVDHRREVCFWARIDAKEAKQTGKNYKLSVPKSQVLDENSIDAISELATQLVSGDRFRATEQSTENFNSLRVTNFSVSLTGSDSGWSKHEVEQVVRQVTADARTELMLSNQVGPGLDSERRTLHVTISAPAVSGTPLKIVARAQCTYIDALDANSTFWDWQFDWDESFFQADAAANRISADAQRYMAGAVGPWMRMFFFLDWAEIQSRVYGYGAYDKSLSTRLLPLLERWFFLDREPPVECSALNGYLTEMVKSVRECQALAASEPESSKFPFLKHRTAGLGLLQKALEHAFDVNAELQRLSRLVPF